MPKRPASAYALRQRALDLVPVDGVHIEELAARLETEGVDLGPGGADHLAQVLDSCSEFIELDDDRWYPVAALIAGLRWTFVVDADAAADDVLRLDPMCCGLDWWLLDHELHLEDGTVLAAAEDGECAELTGPQGWLDDLAGAPATVAVDVATSTLRLAPADAFAPVDRELADAFATTFTSSADRRVLEVRLDNSKIELDEASSEELWWQALLAHRSAFTAGPLPPLDRVLGAAGLERRGTTVMAEGADWLALARWRRRRRWASRFEVDDDVAEALETIDSLTALDVDDPPVLLTSEHLAANAHVVTGILNSPLIAQCLLDIRAERPPAHDQLLGLATALLDYSPRQDSAPLHWLAARALVALGRVVEAEQHLHEAMAIDATLSHVLVDNAALLADRGEAKRAFELLRRAGIQPPDSLLNEHDPGDEDAVEELSAAQRLLVEVGPYAHARIPATAGRNDPCPCGSGRKYKQCHLGKERLPLVERGPWLYDKARRFATSGEREELVHELALTAHRASGRDYSFLNELRESPIPVDIALAEAGVGSELVGQRGPLLPDDEALTAARWALTERSVFEVESLRGDRFALVDLRTGEHIVVTNTRPGPGTKSGDLFLGRPLPIEDTWRAYPGFVKLPTSLLDEAIEVLDRADPFEVATLIGRTFALPSLSNTDGEEILLHELSYALDDPAAARAALAAELSQDDADPDGPLHLTRDTVNQRNTLVLTFRFDGAELVVEANSSRRAAEAKALVERILPTARLTNEERWEPEELMAQRDPAKGSNEPAVSPAELQRFMTQFMAEQEQRWLDESIPALGGRTPRQAAADPVEREALIRLLRSFPDTDDPTQMSGRRLRAALGLGDR